jgi:hypothetical protein
VITNGIASATSYPLLDAEDTDGFGIANPATHLTGQNGTVVTVSHPDYDLFTYQDVLSDRLDVPLFPVGALDTAGSSGGDLVPTTLQGSLLLSGLDRRHDDARRPRAGGPTVAGGACAGFPQTTACGWDLTGLSTGRVGAISVVAGNMDLDLATFGPAAIVQAYELDLPRPPLADMGVDARDLELGPFTTELGSSAPAPEEAHPATLVAEASVTSGIDLANLVDDPAYTGEPAITLEAIVPGMQGGVAVGLGLGLDKAAADPPFGAGDQWTVRSAHPGEVGAAGDLVAAGTIEPDLQLRAELVDTTGNLAGVRAGLTELPGLPIADTIFPAGVSQPILPFDPAAGDAFIVKVTDVLSPAQAATYLGLYTVVLTDSVGRRWHMWGLDEPGTEIRLFAADVEVLGGDPLVPDGMGMLAGETAFHAWQGFDPLDFFWTDVGREFDLYSRSAAFSFVVP